MAQPSLVALNPEEKLKALVEALLSKTHDWATFYTSPCDCFEACNCMDAGAARESAYEAASDDLRETLKDFGLLPEDL